MKYIYSFVLSFLSLIMLGSCAGSNRGNIDPNDSAAITDSVIDGKKNDKTYKPVALNSAEEVKQFLAFKKFSGSSGWIAFNKDGGVIDDESFILTDIILDSPYKDTLKIEVPKMKLSGEYILEQTEEGVTLTDAATGKIYK